MKKFKFSLLCLLIAFSALQSCTDDMNVVSEDDDVLSPDVLYKSVEGYKMGLAGVYGNLSMTGTTGADNSFLQGIDAGTSNFARCLWYLQVLTTEEAVWSYENDAGVADLQRSIWTSENPILLGMFSRTMAEVALANEFLRQSTPERLSARGITAADDLAQIEDFRNETRVLRAYAYYVLMDLFGKAPFVDEATPINAMGPEYGREQLFAFIEEELNAVLPALKEARTNEYGRLDKAFAQMVLAKMYLNAEVYIGTAKYAECIEKCNAIIASGYTLEGNYLDNFKADNNTSTETIFNLQSDGVATQTYGVTTVIINGQIGEWEMNGADFGVGGWGGALRVRKQFVQKFEDADFDFDARKTIGTGIAGDPTKQRPVDIANIPTKTQGYIISKFSNISSTGVPGPNSTFVNTDFPLFRLADVYLMYAEAVLRGGGGSTGDALAYVNALRQRANGGSTAANITLGELDLPFILDERLRELHWESHRRQDLIRFGKFTGGSYNWAWKGNAANGISIPAYRKLFPIPFASLNANTNLSQNTGY